ncbi:ABC transporter, ATP-binding protein [Acidisarcina polymorpha]|uniref:ABC transporter, ATP-binding protein n=1 Tax=Acidisarcina polymorpha TaxID=2211140 RepID=A0A2Z5FXC3_9BACT|nr:ABC transporter ATP-binding protein [Acidisarcina polymorpha]AXC11432.1 ABC transporter, ATP-binding protein [Acidisarcina polymorpha]
MATAIEIAGGFQSRVPNRSFAGGAAVARVAGVSKSYGSVQALREVELSIHAGEVVALLGPNGAGKSTLVKLLLGLASPTLGRVSVFGGDPKDTVTRERVGSMMQVGGVPATMKVREHIDLFSSYYPKPLLMTDVIELAGLQGIEQRQFGELSGGQKQRVLFALALCGDPDLLFLDEPTVGLDVEARRGFWDQIRRLAARGKTVLLTTHYLEEADALADRVVVINKGSIVAEGTPASIKASTAGKKIRVVTRMTLSSIERMAGVVSVSYDREAVEIQTSAAEATLRELLAADGEVSGLEVSNAGIEEAFLALTK